MLDPKSYWPSGLLPRLRRKEALCAYTTFRIGGPAAWLFETDDPDELCAVVAALAKNGQPWRLIGGGSNLLISDEGLPDVVLVYRGTGLPIVCDETTLIASGAAPLAELVEAGAAAGLAGLAFAAGIPGTVGGALYGNAGAFGGAVGDRLLWADLLDTQGRVRRAAAHELGFAYRRSALKTSGAIVLHAAFGLQPAAEAELREEAAEHLAYRSSRHPDWRVLPTAGSFFKNLEPLHEGQKRRAAGAFLDQVGARGARLNDAGVYVGHANILVNHGSATAGEVIALALRYRRLVQERFGLDLRREVQIWPSCLAPELPE